MNKSIQIATKIKFFYNIFDKRTYDTFKNVISAIISLRSPKQADISNLSGKVLHQIQYFFNKSIWDYNILNNFRLSWIRNKISGAGNKKSDILLLDSTIIAKSKNASFSGLSNFFFSNKDKKIVNGFDIFGASIITKSGVKYILDICIFFKKSKNKLNSQNKRNPSIQNTLWLKFISKLFTKTKSWLVVMDSGFKGGHIAKWIHIICKRHFLVRIGDEQYYYDNLGKPVKIKDYLKEENKVFVNGLSLWIIKKVRLKSWKNKGINLDVNLIIYHKKGFRKPVILCTSADIGDIYENMFREKGDLSWNEKVKNISGENSLVKAKTENEIYISFVLLYQKRWSIEVCFRELKTYLGFEKFQVSSYNSIMKYLHICILVHTLLYITLNYIYFNTKIRFMIYDELKQKRNIKNNDFYISFDGLKLFFEMITINNLDFSFKSINFSISLKSCFYFNNQLILD